MKKILIMLLAICLCGCNSPEYRAKKLVKKHIKTNIDNPSSYKAGEFSELYTYYATEFDASEYEAQIKQYAKERDNLLRSGNSVEANQILDKISQTQERMQKDIESFTPNTQIDAYFVIHAFRAQNEYGAIVKYFYEYVIDKNISEVLDEAEITNDWLKMVQSAKKVLKVNTEGYHDWAINSVRELGYK